MNANETLNKTVIRLLSLPEKMEDLQNSLLNQQVETSKWLGQAREAQKTLRQIKETFSLLIENAVKTERPE